MCSLASPLNLGSANAVSFCKFDSSVFSVRRVPFRRNGISFRKCWTGKRWKYAGVCKYFVTTNYIPEQRTSISLDSEYRGSKDNADSFLMAAAKPVLKTGSNVDPLLSMAWEETRRGRDMDDGTMPDREERTRVIESLAEVLEKVAKLEICRKVLEEAEKLEISRKVLEKAEKLETSRKVLEKAEKLETTNKVNFSSDKLLADDQMNGKPIKSVQYSIHKSKTLKSVWRKGNLVAEVVKEPPKQEPKMDGGGAWSKTFTPLRPPRSPQRVESKLRTKASAAPPPMRKSELTKDVNAAAKSPFSCEAHSGSKFKLRKPILIDKYESKKPVVEPKIAQAVLAPRKPGKSPANVKFKDEFRKKSGSLEGSHRRMVDGKDDILDEDMAELDVSIPGASGIRKGRKWSKASRKAARLQATKEAAPVRVEIMEVGEDGMLIEELAYNLAVSEGDILGYMYGKGIRPDGVLKLSKDMVKMLCKEYKVEVIDAVLVRVEEMAKKKEIFYEDDLDKLECRPPVVTIMGHVDHGKTTLLDYIRKSKVAAAEAGGITQGIGAYKVKIPIDGKTQICVFLDTPGHEAFGAMRARGARVTDIAVIVVAADDGLRPQTNEAIAHAKAARVPIIVAINKIDKDGANPDRVLQDLSLVGLIPEEWGGDIPMVKISALKGENVDELLETIMLVAELQELKANPHRNAKGAVIEAGLDKSKGPVATFIVQNGTLRKGHVVVCGEAFGKVRALFDDNGNRVDEAGPSIPVQVMGLNNVPLAGDEFEIVGSLDTAREKAESRAVYLRNEHITAKAGDGKVTLSSLTSAVSSGKSPGLDLHQLNIILKVDVQGSIEAVRQALQALPQDNVTLKFLLQATGDVSTSDVDLSVAGKAIIFGFNVRMPGSVRKYADSRDVEVRIYKVIYELIDDVRNAMEGLLDHVEEQVPIGSAEVGAVFSSGSGQVAGCMVTQGKVVKDCGIRVLRKGKEVYVGVLGSLRRVKEMVKEVNAGLECGIGTEDFSDWQVGDTIEAFNTVQKKRTLEEASASMSAAYDKIQL